MNRLLNALGLMTRAEHERIASALENEGFDAWHKAASELLAALVAAKQEMWLAARDQWTMADFKNWAIVQQIDAALDKARPAITKATGHPARNEAPSND